MKLFAKESRCSFCRAARRDVRALIAGPDAAICNVCVAYAQGIMDSGDDGSGRVWARTVTEMVVGCTDDDARPIEALNTAAIALWRGDATQLGSLLQRLSARNHVRLARCALAVADALGWDKLALADAVHAVICALLTGDVAHATQIQPALPDDAASPTWTLTSAVATLVAFRDQDPRASALVEEIAEIHRGLDEDTPEPMLAWAGLAEGLACARAGHWQRAIKRYAAYRKHVDGAPWHLLAYGDALAASGSADARATWTSVANQQAWQPYWTELATERLQRVQSPYR